MEAAIAAPELHGNGEAVESAAAKVFGGLLAGLDGAESEAVEAETVQDGAQIEAQTAPEAPETALEAAETPAEPSATPDLDKLRQIALEKAKTREAKGAETAKSRDLEARLAQIEAFATQMQGKAQAFDALQQLAASDPIALIEKLGHDPVKFVQSAHRQAIDRVGHTREQKLAQLEAEIAQLKGQVTEIPQHIEQRNRQEVNTRARREFVAITSNDEAFPFLAIEPPEVRLALAQEMAGLLEEAGEEITHERVAGLAEQRARADYERRTTALRKKTGGSPDETALDGGQQASSGRAQGSGKPRPKTLTNSLAAEPSASREKTPQERERAAATLAGRLFGGHLS